MRRFTVRLWAINFLAQPTKANAKEDAMLPAVGRTSIIPFRKRCAISASLLRFSKWRRHGITFSSFIIARSRFCSWVTSLSTLNHISVIKSSFSCSRKSAACVYTGCWRRSCSSFLRSWVKAMILLGVAESMSKSIWFLSRRASLNRTVLNFILDSLYG